MRSKILLLLALLLSAISIVYSQTRKDYPIEPVLFTQVKITDGFWFDRMETNRTVTISYAIKMRETTGRVTNLEIAAGFCRRNSSIKN